MISDKKIGVLSDTNSSLIGHYEPEIVSAQDYYPFGMPSRSFIADVNSYYRFGFNGKEMDHEPKGPFNQLDYGMRIYDPRSGCFLSVDPLAASFPWNSPYSYTEGNPINYLDLDGMERTGTAPRITVPQIGPMRVDRNGNIVNSTQLFTSGTVNAGDYLAPLPAVKIDYNDYVNPYAVTAQVVRNSKGIYVVGQLQNGLNYISTVYEVPPKTANSSWVDRLIAEDWQRKVAVMNSFTRWNQSIQAYEVFTNDPSTLDNNYLSEVQRRIINGNATAQDKIYADEIRRRRLLYEVNDKHNPIKPLGGSDASVIPDNHLHSWETRSHYEEGTDTWWSSEGTGKKAVFHRFSGDRNGAYHWSGSTGNNVNRKGKPVDPIPTSKVPKEVKRAAGYKG